MYTHTPKRINVITNVDNVAVRHKYSRIAAPTRLLIGSITNLESVSNGFLIPLFLSTTLDHLDALQSLGDSFAI